MFAFGAVPIPFHCMDDNTGVNIVFGPCFD